MGQGHKKIMSFDGFIESAYAAYKSFMEAFVESNGEWRILKDDMVAVIYRGQLGNVLTLDEYKAKAGYVIGRASVHLNLVDGFKKNRSINEVAVERFQLAFEMRGILKREPLLGCLLQDQQLVNDSRVSVVRRSGEFAEGFPTFSFTVLGGNHRVYALKALGEDFVPGSKAELADFLVPVYVRGNEYNRFIDFDIIAVPHSVSGLCAYASNDNMKSQVCVVCLYFSMM